MLDDVGFADLGCYGSETETPNVDRLAANGLLYTNFHTTAMCSPTRASLLTGRNHHAVGMGIIARIDRMSTPDVTNRSYTITAEVEIPTEGVEGVLLACGNRFGGYALFVKDGRAVYEYVYTDNARYVVRSDAPLPVGRSIVRFELARTGGPGGVGTLFVGDRRAGSVEIPKTWPVAGISGGLHCGRDGDSPVSNAYDLPFEFTGTLHRVVVELGEGGQRDPVAEYRGALAEE